MNRVLLTGRLTRDPELRTTAGGKAVAQFSVATHEYVGGKEKSEFHSVVTWDRLAETCGTLPRQGPAGRRRGPDRDPDLGRRQGRSGTGRRRSWRPASRCCPGRAAQGLRGRDGGRRPSRPRRARPATRPTRRSPIADEAGFSVARGRRRRGRRGGRAPRGGRRGLTRRPSPRRRRGSPSRAAACARAPGSTSIGRRLEALRCARRDGRAGGGSVGHVRDLPRGSPVARSARPRPRGAPAPGEPLDLARAARDERLDLGARGLRASSAASARAAPRRPAPPADDDDDLAAGGDRAVGRLRRELAERPADDLLVELGELAAHGAGAVRRRRPSARSRSVAASRVGASNRTLPRSSAAIAGQPLPPLAAGPRQEPLERPARPGDPRRRDRGEHGRGPGIGTTRAALGRPGRDEPLARVGDDGRAGVGDEREVRARPRGGRAARARGRARSARGSSTVPRRDLVAVEQPPA